MSHRITVEYLRAALEQIEKCEGPFKRDPLAHAESCIAAMAKVAHEAINGEWDSPEELGQGPERLLVTPEQLQALVNAMGRVDHGSDWDGPSHFPDGSEYTWTGKPHYEEKYRRMLAKALPVLGFEV
jgi:hypothetical protein